MPCVALLGDDRREDDLARRASSWPSSRRAASAASVTTSERAQTTAPTSSSDGATTTTRVEVAERLGRVRLVVGQHDARPAPARPDGLEEASAPPSSTARRTSARRRARACPPAAWLASADRSAALAALRLTFWSNVRGTFAKAWPPPVNCGGADRARRGAAGALLAPRLRAAAGDEPAALRRERARRGARSARRARPRGRGAASPRRRRWPRRARRPSPCAPSRRARGAFGAAISRAPRRGRSSGPGTEPLTSSRFRSASTSCTVSPSWVTRLPPMRPAILMPLKTRDGVAEAPIEPGLRTLCEPCDRGPLREVVALDRALEALADPDPGDLDLVAGLEHLDRDRLALDRAVDRRRGTRRACGAAPTPKRFRWPSSGRVSFRSATASKASWTAS